MAEGHVAFLGSTQEAVQNFEQLGRPCPALHNPAEHFVRELAVETKSQLEDRARIASIINHYKDSEQFKKMDEGISHTAKINTVKPNIISRKVLRATMVEQFRENMRRGFLVTKRNIPGRASQVVQSVAVSLLLALAFFNTKNNQEAAQNKAGLLFFFVTFLAFSWSSTTAVLIPRQFPVIKKEYKRGMYGIFSYFISTILTTFPLGNILVAVQLILFYFLTGLHISVPAFFTCYFISISVVWASYSVGIFCGAVTRSSTSAESLQLAITVPSLLLGGLYQYDKATQYWFVPFKYLSWIRYGWTALMANEFSNIHRIECDIKEIGYSCQYSNGTQVLSAYGIEKDIWWPNIVANGLIGWGMCWSTMACLWWRIRI